MMSYLEDGAEIAMEQKVDRSEYSEEELISIKTALNLPYYSSNPSFERAYGSVSVDGVVYQYVKKRVYRDTLELLCLPNEQKTALLDIRNELTKSTADGQATVPGKKGPSVIKISLPDFYQVKDEAVIVWLKTGQQYGTQNETFFPSAFRQQPDQPPQVA